MALGLPLVIGSAWAVPPLQTASLATPGTQRTLFLPPNSDDTPVISLGTAVDPQTGEKVEGLAIIHYKGQAIKPAKPPRGGESQCFVYLAGGAKWRTVEPWVVNPQNTRGLESGFLFSNLTADVAKWEDAADGTLGDGGIDILGEGTSTSDLLTADTASPDGQNEVYFANVSTSKAIAVTIVWGVFGGPPSGRRLVEWDQIYDDYDYDWSPVGETGKMDFENIATHELGHSVGMGDLYNTCVYETMYGYAGYGETLKRDLNTGDIAGINGLY